MFNDLTLITGNAGKAAQFAKYLEQPVFHEKLDLIEIQTLDVEEVLRHKAEEAFRIMNKPVLVDDTALVFSAFGKLPRPFIKYFLTELGPEKLCRLLDPFEDRTARAEVAIGFYDGQHYKTFSGKIQGTIASNPQGTGGFGWDVIFIPKGFNSPRATFDEQDYDATSPRKIALEKLHDFLKAVQ